jgi:hypothetical protein
MLSSLVEKILLAALAVTMVCGVGATFYAMHEHHKVAADEAQVEAMKLTVATANANAAAAASDAAATKAAFTVQSAQLSTAKQKQAVSSARLATAVAANPSVVAVQVPADVWEAIYGSPDAAK